jgi:hypothetical protein
MSTTILPTKTFKEVHEELELESLFLQQNHNVRDFSDKANFLSEIGFKNSIATKLYKAISENSTVIQDYNRKYNGVYKFILLPQLERICEKYNLYVRPPELFLGDIPEKNIRDIQNFKIRYGDTIFYSPHKEPTGIRFQYTNGGSDDRLVPLPNKLIELRFNTFLSGYIEIAAVKSLFHSEAFAQSQERILKQPELIAKAQVDLDPIVLFKTAHGYLIITAWGDEANDELVANQNLN